MFGNSRIERRSVRHSVVYQRGCYESLFEDFGLIDVRIDVSQRGVIFGTEECERRDERTRAHAGDQFEAGPVAMRRPSNQQTGPERAIVAAA